MKTLLGRLAILAAFAALAAACSGGGSANPNPGPGPTPQPTASPVGTASPTPTPSPTPSPTPRPAPGAWIIGETSGQTYPATLDHFDHSLAVANTITGPATDFGGVNRGVGTDAAGNVYLLQIGFTGLELMKFGPAASGNAAPASVTTITKAETYGDNLAVDPGGNAYVFEWSPSSCAVVRVPTTGGQVAPVTLINCIAQENLNSPANHQPPALGVDDQGLLYLVVDVIVTLFDIPTNKYSEAAVFPRSGFVPGTTTTVTEIDSYPYPLVDAEDASGYLYVNTAGNLGLIPPGSHTVSTTTAFNPTAGAPVR
jgi:hypothetical protein